MTSTKNFFFWFLIGGSTLILWPLIVLFDLSLPMSVSTLILLTSFPHFALSYTLMYSKSKTMLNYPLVSFVFPAILLIILVGISFRKELMPVVLHLAFISFFFHISKQSFGVGIFLAPKQNFQYFRKWRALLMTSCLAWAAYGWTSLQDGIQLAAFKSYFQSFAVPEWLPTVLLAMAILSTTGAIALWSLQKLRLSWPQAVLVWTPLLALMVWCLPVLGVAKLGLVPVLHGLQYIPFAWIKFRSQRKTVLFTALVTILMIPVGYLLFQTLPMQMTGMLSLEESEYFVSALYVFLNIHHFVIDRVLWTKDSFYADLARP